MKTTELPIESPCQADWSTMNPRKTGRFCGDCKKVVQDLSSMKQADAKRRVAEAPAGLCIRYLHDEHGNIWFKDTPLVAAASLLKKNASLIAALALMPVLSACMGAAPEEPSPRPTPASTAEPPPPPPPVPPVDPDAGPPPRVPADPVVDPDAGADAAPEPIAPPPPEGP